MGQKTILGIDIGSSTVKVAVADISGSKPIILGYGVEKTEGIKKGIVVNIEKASISIKKAIAKAKQTSNIDCKDAYISISNAYTTSTNSSAILSVQREQIEIADIDKIIHSAILRANILDEYERVHVLPYEFKLDGELIEDPKGMSGNKLEVKIKVIMAQKSSLNNVIRAVQNCDVSIEGIVLSSYASSISVLSEDEKKLGVACIDMGSGTSDIIVYQDGAIKYIEYLAVGSGHITNDLSMAVHTTPMAAEELKIKHGSLDEDLQEDRTLTVPAPGNSDEKKTIKLSMVNEIMRLRVEETLSILSQELEKNDISKSLGAGVVLTGGMSKLKGIKKIAENIFPNIIRLAKPAQLGQNYEELNDAEFSVLVGLISYGAGNHINYEIGYKQVLKTKTPGMDHIISGENLEDVAGINLGDGRNERDYDLSNVVGVDKKDDGSVKKGLDKFVDYLTKMF